MRRLEANATWRPGPAHSGGYTVEYPANGEMVFIVADKEAGLKRPDTS